MPDSKPAFDKYPYTTRSVLQGQGNITIIDKTQLKSYIYQVYDEALGFKKNSVSGAILDTFAQIPFFCNMETLLDTKFQGDLQRYSYCQDTGSPPYEGGFGSTPKIWIEKYFIIKGVINTHQQREVKRGRKSKTNH
tara:strand:+ start:543 stop:950 length:408 start_codon:yes stop_codon:yes gene_type:complete